MTEIYKKINYKDKEFLVPVDFLCNQVALISNQF